MRQALSSMGFLKILGDFSVVYLNAPYIHSLMQNTGDINDVVSDLINDDMTTRGKKTVRSRKFGPGMTDLGILLNG